MGLFKNKKQPAWKTEEPNTKPSLAQELKGYYEELPSWARKTLVIAVSIIFIALIVLCFSFSIGRVYFTPQTDTNEVTSTQTQNTTEETANEESQYASYFYQMENWSFLRSSETITSVENQIYSALLQDDSFEEGSFVFALDNYETTDKGYTAYFYDTPREQYWKATFDASTWKVVIEKVNYEDTPQPPGAELLEEDEAENRGVPVTGDKPTEVPEDAIMLNDTEALNKSLPEQATKNIQTLIDGAKEEYEFEALANVSWIDGSSIIREADNCTFSVQLQNKEGKTLALNISYNAKSNSFSAHSE